MALPALAYYGLIASSWIVPVVLQIIESVQGDPAMDVKMALEGLSREQMGGAERQLAAKQLTSEDIRKEYALPLQDIMTESAGVRSGYYDQQLGTNQGGSSLLQAVAGKLGMDPNELSERFSPRRAGILADMGGQ